MAELFREDTATLNFSVGVLLVIGGKDTPEIQLKTAFIEIDGQPMMMMDGCKLTRVPNAKFLGLTIDENLNWKDHITAIRKTCS